MTITTQDLEKMGKEMIGNMFLGVFPVDKIPPLSCIANHSGFIVNTQSSDLPGQHWIAVKVGMKNIYVFDPLGAAGYPTPLVNYLHSDMKRKVVYNRRGIQHPLEQNCGYHCIRWVSLHSRD